MSKEPKEMDEDDKDLGRLVRTNWKLIAVILLAVGGGAGGRELLRAAFIPAKPETAAAADATSDVNVARLEERVKALESRFDRFDQRLDMIVANGRPYALRGQK